MVLVLACDSPVGEVASAGTFSMMVDDGSPVAAHGQATACRLDDGYGVRTSKTEPIRRSDVTSIELQLSGGRTLQIAILGEPRLGTYSVQQDARIDPFEFYASYSVPLGTLRRTFDITSGAVTVTQLRPTIKARFSIFSHRRSDWPAQPNPGTMVRPEPAHLWLTGSLETAPARCWSVPERR
jgi:hypothetical protein